MAFLARKISLPKWRDGAESESIGADAVTADLRTSGNTLSFWRFESDDEVLYENTALALVTDWDQLEKIDIVCVSEEELRADGVVLERTPGRTLVNDLREHHMDAVRLDMLSLCALARRLAWRIRQDRARRLSRTEVGRILTKAVKESRLVPESLKPRLRNDVGV